MLPLDVDKRCSTVHTMLEWTSAHNSEMEKRGRKFSVQFMYSLIKDRLGLQFVIFGMMQKHNNVADQVQPDASQGAYKLRMAIAQAEIAAVQVRVNDSAMKPVYETPAFGKDDNAIARHGIHGLYALYNIDIPAADLRKGDNIIYLTQRKASGSSNAVMYDNLRLPSPPVSSSSS
ncbi:hypothetical protein AXG93_1626s1110 [Marchantia polymorpha subsp. ruderalis]|uniref:Rhamnogalacturonan lyase domain-containing protein n=1 Tax=Marchantia polymorpha subsp. ruderalis TaxID=1480154 RepID=A0A176W7W0_MARPO|nr:hypothetical protein AXG93_1626s1110 [Marchantia polymorpha subsp. ruderalis]